MFFQIIEQNRERRNEKTQTYAVDFVYEADRLTKLLSELSRTKDLYRKQRLLTSSLCEKYLKLREGKDKLTRRMKKMEDYYSRAMEEAMENFDRDRVAFELLERRGALKKREHEEVVRRCATLSYNNAALSLVLLKAKCHNITPPNNDLARDVSVISIIKDTKDLADYDKNKRHDEQKVLACNEDRFIRFPVKVDDGVQDVPLFEVNETDEECEMERESVNKSESEIFWTKSGQTSSTDLGYKSASIESGGNTRGSISTTDIIRKRSETVALKKRLQKSESSILVQKNKDVVEDSKAPDIIRAIRTRRH